MTNHLDLPEYGLQILKFCFQKKSFAKVNVSKRTVQKELGLEDEGLFNACIEFLIDNGFLAEGQRGGVLIITRKGIEYVMSLK